VTKKRGWKRTTAVVSLLLLAIILGGCASVSVSIQDAVATSVRKGNVAHTDRNPVSIVGVDFDPPLRYTKLVARQGVTMLVAVENYGETEARDLVVTAELTAVDHPHVIIVQRQAYIEAIPPGQVIIERFPRLKVLPRRQRFHLSVQLSPYVSETQTVIDRRVFLIQIGAEK